MERTKSTQASKDEKATATTPRSEYVHGAPKVNPFKIASFDRPRTLENRKVVVLLRNGERMDRVFPEWLSVNFTDAGEYKPTDLNQPVELVKRPGGLADYVDDAPITEIGNLTGQVLGRAIRLHDVWPLSRVYCSPALRCVQTAAAFVKGLNKPIKICVEPGLFDWCRWYKTMPALLPAEDLIRAGMPIDTSYAPIRRADELGGLVGQETLADFYARIRKVMDGITGEPGSNRVAVMCHATTLDAAIKALRRATSAAVTEADAVRLGLHYPYGTVVALAQDRQAWSFVHQPIAPMSYLGISNRADAKFINQTTRAKYVAKYDL
uniref:Phosphoglycerate mutase family protein n=1 Tax=Panagrellus redivivus TaxID=6233 RepID=A0A7E4ZYY7_PANRE